MQVNVMSGDVTRTVEVVDAIATLVNSEGMWFGGVDMAIQRVCGSHYHSYLATQMDQLSDGQVFIVKGESNTNFNFKDVIFVIDDLTLPLKTLIFNILCAAQKADYKRIAMPAMRTGIMAGIVEKTPLETIWSVKQGFVSFEEEFPNSTLEVDIVVYSSPSTIKLIEDNLYLGC